MTRVNVAVLTMLALPAGHSFDLASTFFGPPRTRVRALAYAKKAVFKTGEAPQNDAKPTIPLKSPRRGSVDMVLTPDHVPGTVNAPDWLLPIAAFSCYLLPLLFLYLTGGMDNDTYRRSLSGVTLKQRAVDEFLGWLTHIGVLADSPSPTPSGLGKRGNLPAVSMMTGGEEDELRACINFEGTKICGPARFEGDLTCVFNGQRWVCA